MSYSIKIKWKIRTKIKRAVRKIYRWQRKRAGVSSLCSWETPRSGWYSFSYSESARLRRRGGLLHLHHPRHNNHPLLRRHQADLFPVVERRGLLHSHSGLHGHLCFGDDRPVPSEGGIFSALLFLAGSGVDNDDGAGFSLDERYHQRGQLPECHQRGQNRESLAGIQNRSQIHKTNPNSETDQSPEVVQNCIKTIQ